MTSRPRSQPASQQPPSQHVIGPVERGNGERPIVRQCIAHVPSGRRCRRSAVRGATVCPVHGGAAPQVKAAAARRVAEAKALAVFEKFSPNGRPGPVDVVAELGRLLARVTAFADFAAARIETLTVEQWAAFSPRTAAEVDMFRQALRDAGRLLTETARLGLEERALEAERAAAEAEVWAHQRVGETVGRVVNAALEDMLRAGLRPDTRDPAVRAILAARFRELGGGDGVGRG
jgi:hypothetical protein